MLDLLLQYKSFILNTAKQYCINYENAEEITQDVLLKANKNWHKYDTSKPLEAWLRVITINKCKDFLRCNKNRRRLKSTDVFPEIEDPFTFDPIDIKFDVDRVLDKLSPKSKDLIKLRFVDNLTIEGIAAHIGVSPTTIKTRIGRIVKIIHSNLKEYS